MNVRRVNFALRSAAVVMTAAAVGAIVLAVALPVAIDGAPATANGKPLATAPSTDDAVPALASFEPVWALELRKPLHGPAVPVATAPVAPAAHASTGAAFILAGTIGDSLALIQTPGGSIEVKGVGESAAGGKIVAVRPSEVDVEIGGRVTTLRKPAEPDAR